MRPDLRLIFLAYGNEKTGLGHYYRTLALAQEASCRGHQVVFLSDHKTHCCGVKGEQVRPNDPETFLGWSQPFRPDWVVADLSYPAPDWFRGRWKLALTVSYW